MRKTGFGIAAILALAVPMTAHAQAEISGTSGRDFTHEQTGISIPEEIGDFRRQRINDYGERQFDISGHYGDRRSRTTLTIYLYRAGLPDASIAFDQLLPIMTAREGSVFSQPDKLDVVTFSPPFADAASGIRVTYEPEGDTQYTSNAAMIFPHGSWLVKLRVTSERLSPQEADAVMDTVMAALDLPDPIVQPYAAHRISACTDELQLSEANLTEDASDDQAGPTVLSVMITAMELPAESLEDNQDLAPQPVTWCSQDSGVGVQMYRPNGREDQYVLALNDAGGAIAVGYLGSNFTAIASEIDLRVPVVELDSNGTTVRALYDHAPPPEQVAQILSRGRQLGFTDRIGDIEIDSSVMGGD